MAFDHKRLLEAKERTTIKRASVAPVGQWWTLTGSEAAAGITSTLLSLKTAQAYRLQQMVSNARLYGNLTLAGSLLGNIGQAGIFRPANTNKSAFNVCMAVPDAITAKIAKNKPEPLFLTSGGNFHQQRRAQRLTDYTQGVFYENKAQMLATQAFRDACIWGCGFLHPFPDAGKVKIERVHASEIWVDELEAFYGEPRQMHRVKAVDRSVLKASFKDKEKEIDSLDMTKLQPLAVTVTTSDLLEVRDSYRIASGPDANDGKHIISVGDVVLLEEEWGDWLPFVKLDYSPRAYGYFAQGLVEQLAGIQLEINQLQWVAQRSFFMAGSYKVFLRQGSKVVTDHLSNEVGAIIHYSGDVPPQYTVPPIISPQHLQRIEELKQSAFELAGISQLSASSSKPAGLDSGRALRELTDIESDRFAVVGQAYEQLFVDLARLVVKVSKQIAKSGSEKNLSVKVPGKKTIKMIDWSKCEMDEEEFVTKCFPVSSLPNEPAGRLQTITEMVQAGLISPERGRRLLDFPDLAADESLENAQIDYLVKILDGIVDDGEYTPPDPTDHLQEARKMALQYLAHGRAADLEPERQQMLRDFLDQITTMEQEAAAPTGPAADAGITPQAAPMAPPTSDLIPNAPGVAA